MTSRPTIDSHIFLPNRKFICLFYCRGKMYEQAFLPHFSLSLCSSLKKESTWIQ